MRRLLCKPLCPLDWYWVNDQGAVGDYAAFGDAYGTVIAEAIELWLVDPSRASILQTAVPILF